VLRAGVGLSTERDSARAAAEAAARALRSGNLERTDLALVFATTPHGPGFARVTRTAAEVCGTTQVVGCSAAGVLAGEQEIEGGAGVAVLALEGDVAVRRFFVPLGRGQGERAADEVADAVGTGGGSSRLLLLFADTYHLEPDPFLGRLAHRLPGVTVVGGGASEDGSVGQVAVFAGDACSSAAVAGAVLEGDFRATVGVTHAVRPIGRTRRVTRARGNVLLELDGRPAYEAFASVVPEPLLADPQRALAVVLACLPVGEGEYLSRHLIGFDAARGTITVAAVVGEGAELFFGVRDRQGAREDLQRVLAGQAGAWQAAPPAGGLYVSCVGRGARFHGIAGLETAYIHQQLGALPVAGFFSGAELAAGGGSPHLHQYTGVLALMGPGPERMVA
jgi:small ligand-binding sensory domain FIST